MESGYKEPKPARAQPSQQLRETHKRDAKALFLIQLAMDDEIFPQIAASTTSYKAWETLRKEFLGEQKVITVKLQTLRHEFENLDLQEKEPVQEFLSRVSGIVIHMRTCGENVSSEIIVCKVLKSLTKDFDHAVAAIEESKNLSKYTFDSLMGSLLAHDARINRSYEKVEEKAFQIKGEFSKGKLDNLAGKVQGIRGYHGQG